MNYAQMKNLYDTNNAFHDFVDKSIKSYGGTLESALEKATVKDVAEYYEAKEKGIDKNAYQTVAHTGTYRPEPENEDLEGYEEDRSC